MVAAATRVRAIGARHSFSAIGATEGDLLDLARLDRILSVDPESRTATIEAGVTYEALAPELERAGLALPNLASLPWITVVGACATATHGSGNRHQLLAAAASALDLVTADGELVTLTRERDGDRFRAALVGLGALGIVARLTLDLVPTFTIRQTVYENLPLARLLTNFDEIMGGAYSVSLFTRWRGDTIDMVWVKRRDDEPTPDADADYFGARPAVAPRTLGDQSAGDRVTAQLGTPGPWYERLPHFRSGAMPPIGEELQSEYFIPRQHAAAAARAFAALGPRLAPALILSEVRTVAADDCWLSPYYGRDSVGFPLHLAPRLARRPGTAAADRSGVGTVRRPSALGQNVHHAARTSPVPLPAPGRLPGRCGSATTRRASSATRSSIATSSVDSPSAASRAKARRAACP